MTQPNKSSPAWNRVRSLLNPTAGHPQICESVRAWSQTHPETAYRSVQPQLEITRKLPRTVEPEIGPDYTSRQTATMREKYLAVLHGAGLYGNTGLVVLPDGQLAAESVYGRAVLERELAKLDLRARRERKRGEYFSLLSLWDIQGGSNYYHWLHDALMNVCFVLDLLPPTTRFIVRPNLRPFHLDSLAQLGISPNRLVTCEPDRCWELETLYFSPPTVNSGSDYAAADDWFRQRIWRASAVTPQKQRRLLVSRRHSGSRRAVNEAEIEAFLRAYHFETCMPETLSFREQVALFAQAEMVVGVHGAALTNLLFAPPGTVVVEIMEPSFTHDTFMFWTMCESYGHEYWNFWGDSVPNPGNRPDIFVPLPKLEKTLASIF